MGKDKPSRLSKGSKIRYGSGFTGSMRVETARVNKSSHRLAKAARARNDLIAGLSYEDRELLIGNDVEMGEGASMSFEDGWVDEEAFHVPPPGEEGAYMSHAGGQEEVYNAVLDQMLGKRKRLENRTQTDRVEVQTRAWQDQMENLMDAYLIWKYEGPPAAVSEDTPGVWSIQVFEIYERHHLTFVHAQGTKTTNETLVRSGYLGCSPESVAMAFSFHVLEAYRQFHRACPRFSAQAFIKALCHLQKEPFRHNLVKQFRVAFDAYLEILHRVEICVKRSLNHDTPDWRMRNVCPPCMYKLEDEPPLEYSMFCMVDGNQSLKLIDYMFRTGHQRRDGRTARSDMWMTPEEVDVFKDEVKKINEGRGKRNPRMSDNVGLDVNKAGTRISDETGQEEDTAEEPDDDFSWLKIPVEDDAQDMKADECVQRWRSAAPEARKKMFSLFAVTGVFLAVCRHGHVLVMCDMIKSGELMKYPLALLSKLMDIYGYDLVVGYDIVCAFIKTLLRSSLGGKAKELRLRGVVPAFHGHAHNRGCQLDWHPMYIEGVGLEDFEECERTFSKSNDLAPGTRLATPFHRHQQIEQHYIFQDQDKFASSGNFIYENYRQALNMLTHNTQKLDSFSKLLGTGPADYEEYLISERQHLQSLKTEPLDVIQTVEYMECLQRLNNAVEHSETAKKDFERLDYGIIHLGWQKKKISQVRTLYRTTFDRWKALNEETCRLEESLGIEERWTPDTLSYQQALILLRERKYRRALDKLERLVIQRLFELTKLGLSSVGYKLREKIGKALKARAKAIKKALEDYNNCASMLSPPRPQLSWNKVIEMASLAEFDLLRDTRHDIRQFPWAQPLNRDAMNLYFGIKRAKVEINRLNVEIRRLVTHMLDWHHLLYRTIQYYIILNPPLAHELSTWWQFQQKIHADIARRLVKTSKLSGFTGTLLPGCRVGQKGTHAESIPLPEWAKEIVGLEIVVEDDVEDNEPEVLDGMTLEDNGLDNLVEYFEKMEIDD